MGVPGRHLYCEGKGRASGHQATRLLLVLRKGIPEWVGSVIGKGWEQGSPPPVKTLGLARRKTRRGCKLDKLNFLWGLMGEILELGKNLPPSHILL